MCVSAGQWIGRSTAERHQASLHLWIPAEKHEKRERILILHRNSQFSQFCNYKKRGYAVTVFSGVCVCYLFCCSGANS